MPSFTRYVGAISPRSRQLETVDDILSLRHWWEWNYYHFLLDVLGKLSQFHAAGLDIYNMPLALGPYVNDVPFVQSIISMGQMASLHWTVPQGFVRANSVYYCRTLAPSRARLDFVLDLMGVENAPKGERRVFLNRRLASTRRLINQDEVIDVLSVHGFEEVNTDGMPIERQISIFGQAAAVVAVHGAGMTNVVFRRSSPLAVLELTGDRFLSNDFALICSERGYRWGKLVGKSAASSKGQHADFSVDIAPLRRWVEALDRGA
jgi:capsular polysaccharide biosynthesis protein